MARGSLQTMLVRENIEPSQHDALEDRKNEILFAMIKEIQNVQKAQMEKQENETREFRRFILELKREITDVRSKMKTMNHQMTKSYDRLESLLSDHD